MVYYKTKYSAKGSSLSSLNYRFGYQGSEKDNEVNSSNGTSYTTEFRQLDTRLGRWFSSDPVFQPWQSSYTSMDNNPVNLTDVLGDTPTPAEILAGFVTGGSLELLSQVITNYVQYGDLELAVENINWNNVGSEALSGAIDAAFWGSINLVKKLNKLLNDPKTKIIVEALYEGIKQTMIEAYKAWDEGKDIDLAQVFKATIQSVLANSAAKGINKKGNAKTESANQTTKKAEAKLEDLKTRKDKGGGISDRRIEKAKNDVAKTKKEATNVEKKQELKNESIKKTTTEVLNPEEKKVEDNKTKKPTVINKNTEGVTRKYSNNGNTFLDTKTNKYWDKGTDGVFRERKQN